MPMPQTESDHHRGVAAVARHLDLVAPPAAPATARDEDEEDAFTFAAVAVGVAVPRLQDTDCAFPDARIGGPVYPVFGRPRWSLPKQQQQRQEDDDNDEEEDPAAAGTATVRRVPLERLLLEDRWCDCAPSASGQQPADDAEAELDGVPAETYCLWSPGASPPAASRWASPARCWKSGSTGSSVLRWRRRRRVVVSRSHSDGRGGFVFLGTSFDRGAGEGRGWMNHNQGTAARGGGKSTTTTFLPSKQHLVGLVASAVTFRRSYLPF